MKPEISIAPEVFDKIMYWVNKSSYEVSGLGTVEVDPSGKLHVVSAMLLPQKNTTTHTDIDGESVGKAMFALRDSPGSLRFWWHSHVDMGVFWSGTDMDTIKKLGTGGWFLATVFNKKREMRSAVYLIDGAKTPWGNHPLFLDECKTSVHALVNPLTTQWDLEYTENVTNQTYSGYARMDWAPWEHDGRGNWGPTSTQSTVNPLRPPGTSKREWKRLRKANRIIVTGETKPTLPVELDPYGFDQEDRMILAKEGWTDHDVDTLFEEDFTPREIIRLCCTGCKVDDILALIGEGWRPNDIIDGVNQRSTLIDLKEAT